MAKAFDPIRCRATLRRPASPANATWGFLRLPPGASAALPSRGMVAVDVAIGAHAFTAVLEPDGEGGHWLKLPRAVQGAVGIAPGDRVSLLLSPAQHEPEPVLPADLRAALAQVPGAHAQWQAITIAARRDFIQWLDTARQAETRVRRIRTACDMLAQGKRRICCFDRSGLHGKGPRAPAAADD